MEFGKSLRNAREAKGYTIAQIAEKTHMLSAIVEGLENEDFSRIAAPIYGRSFIRLYCETVGLEAKPFVDEFMEILNGNRAPAIKERPTAVVAPSESPILEEPPLEDPLAATSPVQEPEKAPETDLFSSAPASAVPEPPAPGTQTVSRYASTFRVRESMALPVLPWRLIVLGIAALTLLVLVVFGIRALYSATTSKSASEAEPATTVTETATAPAATPVTRTQQQKIPSLYID